MMRRSIVPALAIGLVAVAAACHGKAEFPYQHRDAPQACPVDPRFADAGATVANGTPNADQSCSRDEECTQGTHPRCVSHGHQASHCSADACMSDGDCAAGTTCACDRDGNRCVPSNCRSDADCGGLGCSPTEARSCNAYGGIIGYYCHTKKDSCTDSNDCSGRTSNCEYETETGRWACVDHGTCVG